MLIKFKCMCRMCSMCSFNHFSSTIVLYRLIFQSNWLCYYLGLHIYANFQWLMNHFCTVYCYLNFIELSRLLQNPMNCKTTFRVVWSSFCFGEGICSSLFFVLTDWTLKVHENCSQMFLMQDCQDYSNVLVLKKWLKTVYS